MTDSVPRPGPQRVLRDEYYNRERIGKYAHFCYDWDEWLISEEDPEFESCTHFPDDPVARGIQNAMWIARLDQMERE